jgi:beta-glucosidase
MEKYLDASLSPEERADDLISKMSLEELLGQVRGYMPRSRKDSGELLKQHPHGVGQISMLLARMCDSADEVAKIQRDLQKKVMSASEHHIPAVFHMEGLCGAQITGDLSLPSGLMRGASFDPELEERLGQVVSRQELACGITQVLAPVLDVARDPRMGRHNESEGEDPTLIARLGSAFTKGGPGKGHRRQESRCLCKAFYGIP